MDNKIGNTQRLATPRTSSGLRVCMIVYSFYESDTRVLQYATALTKRGDSVDVIALKRDDASPERTVLDGVNVHRIQSRTLNEKGSIVYATRILRFLVRAALLLRRLHQTHHYDLIHVHNVPDFLVFSAVFPRAKGVPVILDVHDVFPELYASKFKISGDSWLFKFLVFIERRCAAFATHVIIANHLWRDRFVDRSCHEGKCSVVRNYPDLELFAPTRDEREGNGKFRMTYPGSLNEHQGVDVAVRAFASIADLIPAAEFHIYGEGPAKSSLIALSKDLGMVGRIVFHDFLPSREIAKVIAKTDLAIEPKRVTSAFANEALSTKILEFMASGVPVVASRTKIHTYYYDDSIVLYYEDDDEAQLARQILLLVNDPDLRRRQVANATRYVQKNNWGAQKHEYLQLIDSLVMCESLQSVGTVAR
jgi:glycosyltransferase involved in cell wall biosynthesis